MLIILAVLGGVLLALIAFVGITAMLDARKPKENWKSPQMRELWKGVCAVLGA